MSATITTGVPELDEALGIGGYPADRIVELYAREPGLALSVALRAVAAAERDERNSYVIDGAGEWDGAPVDPERTTLVQPRTVRQALHLAHRDATGGLFSVVVVTLPSNPEPNDWRLVSQELRSLAIRRGTNSTLLFASTLRQKIGAVFGHPEASGNALKFYASARIDVRRTGKTVTARVVKNKCAAPFRDAEFAA